MNGIAIIGVSIIVIAFAITIENSAAAFESPKHDDEAIEKQKDLARKMGRSEAVISRWTSGFPNLTLKSIAEMSTALGEPLIKVTE